MFHLRSTSSRAHAPARALVSDGWKDRQTGSWRSGWGATACHPPLWAHRGRSQSSLFHIGPRPPPVTSPWTRVLPPPCPPGPQGSHRRTHAGNQGVPSAAPLLRLSRVSSAPTGPPPSHRTLPRLSPLLYRVRFGPTVQAPRCGGRDGTSSRVEWRHRKCCSHGPESPTPHALGGRVAWMCRVRGTGSQGPGGLLV